MREVRLMKNKKGFIATSVIYAFFLMFLMMMVIVLAQSVNNRVLVRAVKDDIRDEMENNDSLVNITLENRTYTIGEVVSYAAESWQVIQNKTSSVVLMLNRGLSQTEIESYIRAYATDSMYFGTCSGANCQVRECLTSDTGGEYCYISGSLYRRPMWNPTVAEIQDQNYGQTLPSVSTRGWFSAHQYLQRALEANKLVQMTFSDGFKNNTSYVRLPLSTEVSGNPVFSTTTPFHLVNAASANQINIYSNGTVSRVTLSTAAYVRPVIEVVKG